MSYQLFDNLKSIAVIVALAGLMAAVALMQPQTEWESLKLDYVIDGDTIIAEGRRIRLWGIDAPEKNEALFETSRQTLIGFLEDQSLSCEFIEKDRYKREVMRCKSNDENLGSMMVKSGMAKDYSRYSGDYYLYEETQAKKNGLGIW